jgi:hypothetical protein
MIKKEIMKQTAAILILSGICLILAILLLTNIITTILSGAVFAISLIILEILSRGFKNN